MESDLDETTVWARFSERAKAFQILCQRLVALRNLGLSRCTRPHDPCRSIDAGPKIFGEPKQSALVSCDPVHGECEKVRLSQISSALPQANTPAMIDEVVAAEVLIKMCVEYVIRAREATGIGTELPEECPAGSGDRMLLLAAALALRPRQRPDLCLKWIVSGYRQPKKKLPRRYHSIADLAQYT